MKKIIKIMLFRMWAAGAVCFFGAWGRSGLVGAIAPGETEMQNAAEAFSFNLIAGLIAVMIICDILIVNPVIRLASGQRLLGEEKKGLLAAFSLPLKVIKVTAIMLLVVCTYYFLNVLFIRIFGLDESSVPVPLEPFLFGIFYGLYWLLFEVSGNVFKNILPKINKERIQQ